MTGPTKPQGDFCLTPGFTARDKRAEWCGVGGGGRALSFSSQSPETHSLSLFNMHASNIPSSQRPIVPFCAARCRLGEDRLPKRTGRRVRSQGAGVRATQGSTGAFIDSTGTRGQRGAGAGSTSLAPCRSVYTPTAGHCPKAHLGRPARIGTFPPASFSLGSPEAPPVNFGPGRPGVKERGLGWCLRPPDNPTPRGYARSPPCPEDLAVTGKLGAGCAVVGTNSGIRYCTTNDAGRVLALTQQEQLQASVGNKGRLCSVSEDPEEPAPGKGLLGAH